MKIYLAGSIAGGREFVDSLVVICDILEQLGHEVLTKNFVVYPDPNDSRAATIADREKIVARDKTALKSADAVIMEISQASHGVGFELCFSIQLSKPILLLKHLSLKDKRHSAFLDGQGYEKLELHLYNKENIAEILSGFIKEYE